MLLNIGVYSERFGLTTVEVLKTLKEKGIQAYNSGKREGFRVYDEWDAVPILRKACIKKKKGRNGRRA